jgi:hypothetical protein
MADRARRWRIVRAVGIAMLLVLLVVELLTKRRVDVLALIVAPLTARQSRTTTQPHRKPHDPIT